MGTSPAGCYHFTVYMLYRLFERWVALRPICYVRRLRCARRICEWRSQMLLGNPALSHHPFDGAAGPGSRRSLLTLADGMGHRRGGGGWRISASVLSDHRNCRFILAAIAPAARRLAPPRRLRAHGT